MSVRKRRWTTPAGEARERWQADYVDGQGKRRRKMFRLKKEADQFVAGAVVEVRDGLHVPDAETITVKEAVKLWMSSGAAAGLERTTLDQRRQHAELHILPYLGETRLNRITAPAVRSFQDKLREEGRSPAMIRRVTVSLGSILADAQGRGLVIRNAVHEISRSRRSSGKASEKRQKARLQVGRDIPTNFEIRALLSAASGRYRPMMVTAIFTGLRASELRGLRWEDVDLDKGLLHVRQRADRYRDIGLPKSSAGQRIIPMSPLVTNTLRDWKKVCPKSETGLAFPNGEGNVEFHQNVLQRGYWPMQIAAGVTVEKDGELRPKYPGLHALRHWFASWCINRRVDGGLELSPKLVQARMGHSSIQVTLDTYAHLFPAVDEMEALGEAESRLLAVPDGTKMAQAEPKAS